MKVKICDICKNVSKPAKEIRLPCGIDNSIVVDRFDARCRYLFPEYISIDLCFDCFIENVFNKFYSIVTKNMNAQQKVELFKPIRDSLFQEKTTSDVERK